MTNLLLILLLLVGCEEDNSDIYGCMNPDATNYRPKATVDNGNCVYEEASDDSQGEEPSCHVDVCLSLDGNNLNYESMLDIAGFQFNHDGCLIAPYASGGDAALAGFSITASPSTVLGFSFSGTVVSSGIGTLITLNGEPSQVCLSNLIFSGLNGLALVVELSD